MTEVELLYYQNKHSIAKLVKQLVRKHIKSNFKLPLGAKTSGRYDKGVKLKFHNSLWILYPRLIVYLFNLFFKKKIFFLDAIFTVLKLATKRKDYAVHCYLLVFYVWLFYVWSCKLWLGVPTFLAFPVVKRVTEFILLWFGFK